MRAARRRRYKDLRTWAPLVCSVDDCWFEGSELVLPVVETMPFLGGLHSASDSLSALRDALNANPSAGIDGDGNYLRMLAELCCKAGFHLELCNFEGLEQHWSELNAQGTAVLLDVNYHKAEDGLSSEYGLRLIQRLLKGTRPFADVFVITGNPPGFQETLANHADDPDWWLVRTLPVVSKTDAAQLSTDLNCFSAYFSAGNAESPVTSLLRSVVWAYETAFDWAHPDRFSEVPGYLPLRRLYEQDEESIKALFFKDCHEDAPYAPYSIKPSVVASLLSTSGFVVTLAAGFPDTLHLPRAPFGVFWLAQAWDSLRWMLADAAPSSVAVLSSEGTSCSMSIPLNEDHSEGFLASLSAAAGARAGRAVQAVVGLLNGKFREGFLDERLVGHAGLLRELEARGGFRDPTYAGKVSSKAVVVTWKGFPR